jgi:hypothetical protein
MLLHLKLSDRLQENYRLLAKALPSSIVPKSRYNQRKRLNLVSDCTEILKKGLNLTFTNELYDTCDQTSGFNLIS